MKRTVYLYLAFVAMLMLLVGFVVVPSEDQRIKMARDILDKYQESVVWVSVEVKMQSTYMGIYPAHAQQHKHKRETVGAVIHPSGLIVICYSMVDPTSLMHNFVFPEGEENMGIEIESSLENFKIHLADGTEVPARLVSKDLDLNLAFIMPQEDRPDSKSVKMASIKLERSGKARALDEIAYISRLDKSLDRELSVTLSRISAVVCKSRRTFYIDGHTDPEPGTPVFTLDGQVLGIVGRHISEDSIMGAVMPIRDNITVILSVEDIMSSVKRVLANKQER